MGKAKSSLKKTPYKKSSGGISKNKKGDQDSSGLGANSIRFNKQHGQHILKNPLIIDGMLTKAGLRSTDVVLEIGPGTGNLTTKLLEKAAKVHAFEIDPRMVSELIKRFQSTPVYSKLNLILGDVIKVSEKEWPRFNICVTNLPYQISSPFLFKLAQLAGGYRCAVVMLQKEFAERLIAKPDDRNYCRLTANIRLHLKVECIMKVSRNSFKPPPKVDSMVVRLEPRNPKPPVSFEEYDGLLRVLFARKNKRIKSNFCVTHVLEKLVHNYNLLLKIAESKKKQQKNESTNSTTTTIDEINVEQMKEKIVKLLGDNGFGECRARKMSEEQILSLLLTLKKEGILFA